MSDVMEAMARVLCCGDDGTRPDRCSSDCSGIKAKIPQAHRLIRAAEASGGLVVGKMPEDIEPQHGQSLQKIWWCHGNNHALAAVRAAAVKVEGV